jgi:uncharacterized membrane protein YjjB (DUF3815 family)
MYLLHQTICGALAATGFGVLFNIGSRGLPWCFAGGALALALRTTTLGGGWSMEAASFVAAMSLGIAVQLLPSWAGVSRNALHVAGCIPMIPGGFATKAILGLFAIAVNDSANNETLVTALDNTLRVMFTIGALGTGLAIPNLILQGRRTNRTGSATAS